MTSCDVVLVILFIVVCASLFWLPIHGYLEFKKKRMRKGGNKLSKKCFGKMDCGTQQYDACSIVDECEKVAEK